MLWEKTLGGFESCGFQCSLMEQSVGKCEQIFYLFFVAFKAICSEANFIPFRNILRENYCVKAFHVKASWGEMTGDCVGKCV